MGAESKPETIGVKGAVQVIATVFVAFLVVRTFLFQQFYIPSGSMQPTLLVGEWILVSKFTYGFSRYSLPFSPPLFSGRILGAEPGRGDVVVFRLPRSDSEDLIKRVVGLPGDQVQMIAGILHLNGQPVRRERLADGLDPEEFPAPAVPVKRWRETLPNGVSYTTLDILDNGPLDDTPVHLVPAGHYFMMGDNRDGSTDSRVLAEVGYVPFDHIVGRAQIIYFSIGDGIAAWQVWHWPMALRFARFFTLIR